MIIVMYDGQCMFCEGWVKFVLRNTKSKNIMFVPIQFSGLDEINLLLHSDIPSMIVVDTSSNEVFFDATASLKVMKNLKFGISFVAYTLSLLPKFITNYFYRLIGRNRHLIFGKSDVCELPSNVERSFFVGDANQAFSLYKKEAVDIAELNNLVKKKYSN